MFRAKRAMPKLPKRTSRSWVENAIGMLYITSLKTITPLGCTRELGMGRPSGAIALGLLLTCIRVRVASVSAFCYGLLQPLERG